MSGMTESLFKLLDESISPESEAVDVSCLRDLLLNLIKDTGGSMERADQQERADRMERVDRPERADRMERVDRPERADRMERVDRPERADRMERVDRPERSDRMERVDRPERADRMERVDRPERADRMERVDRPERVDRMERVDRVKSTPLKPKPRKGKKEEARKLREEIDRLEKGVEKLQNQLIQRVNMKDLREALVGERQNMLKELKDILAGTRVQNTPMETDVSSTSRDILKKGSKKTQGRVSSRVEQQKSRKALLEVAQQQAEKRKSLKAHLERLEEKNNKIQEMFTKFQETVRQRENTSGTGLAEINRLRNEVQNLHQEFQNVKQQMLVLRKQYGSTEKEMQDTHRAPNLQEAVLQLQAEFEEIDSKIRQAVELKKQKEADTKKLYQVMKEREKKVLDNGLRKIVKKLKSKMQTLENKALQSEKTVVELETEFNRVFNNFSEHKETFQNAKERIFKKLDRTVPKSELNHLKEELKALELSLLKLHIQAEEGDDAAVVTKRCRTKFDFLPFIGSDNRSIPEPSSQLLPKPPSSRPTKQHRRRFTTKVPHLIESDSKSTAERSPTQKPVDVRLTVTPPKEGHELPAAPDQVETEKVGKNRRHKSTIPHTTGLRRQRMRKAVEREIEKIDTFTAQQDSSEQMEIFYQRTVGVQTDYREGEAQTDPYQLTWDPNVLEESELIERKRTKKDSEETLPPPTDPAQLEKMKRMMERKKRAFREKQIEKMQETRIAHTERILRERISQQEEITVQRLDNHFIKLQKEKEGKVRKLRNDCERSLRKLDVERQHLDERLKKRQTVFMPSPPSGGEPQTNVLTPKRIRDRRTRRIKMLLETQQALKDKKEEEMKEERPLRRSYTVERPEPRPPTPEVEAPPEGEEERELAVIRIQTMLRGRAVQKQMLEGLHQEHSQLLIQEMRESTPLMPEEQQREEQVRLDLQRRREIEEREIESRAHEQSLVEGITGAVIVDMLDFLSKEQVRLQEDRRIQSLMLPDLKLRYRREAEESGRRQMEERRRREEDEIFRQVMNVHQSTVDMFLGDLFLGTIDQTAEAQAREEIQTYAEELDERVYAMEETRTDEQSEEIVAELVHGFLFPEVKRVIQHEKVKHTQRGRLTAVPDHGTDSPSTSPRPLSPASRAARSLLFEVIDQLEEQSTDDHQDNEQNDY